MPRARKILDWVLDELKAGKTHHVKSLVICSAGVVDRHRRSIPILIGCEPVLKGRAKLAIPLQIDAPDLSGSVIEIVIGRKLVVSGFFVDSRFTTPKCRA